MSDMKDSKRMERRNAKFLGEEMESIKSSRDD